MTSLLSILGLGFVLGLRHATDADHVVAVTTILASERDVRRAAAVGALWGAGHTTTLFVLGGAMVAFRLTVPPRVGLALEFFVAVMLLVLGAMNLRRAAGPATATSRHAHPHRHERATPPGGLRPLTVGMVHGLAGSAAVALLVLTTIRETAWALLYLAVFGVGTIGGMVALTVAMMVPLAELSRRVRALPAVAAGVSGFASVALGLALTWQIGVVDGLFTAHPSWSPH